MSQQQAKEQRPEYRSVKMASPAMSTPLRSPFSVQTPKPRSVLSMNQVSFPPKQSTSTKPWTLCNPLPTIPAGYMLERNQIHLQREHPQDIADRISECLQLRSFVVTETSSEIKNAFRAESTNGLLFRINFFQHSHDSELTIEFQRLNGCSYEFQKTFQAIHRCVFRQEETQQELEFPTCVIPTCSKQEQTERLLDTFQIAMDMLASPRVDCQLLGLEVLEPISTNPDIVSMLLDSEHLSTLLNFCKGKSESQSELEQQQECLLKRRALSILANALESRLASDNNDTVIVNTLVTCLNNNACRDAHQSFQVARCLVVLSKTMAPNELSRAMSLLSGEQQQQKQSPFLQQEFQKLESILSSSA